MKIYTHATERLKQLHRDFGGLKSGRPDTAIFFDNVDHNEQTGNFNSQSEYYDYMQNGYTLVNEEKFIEIVCPQTKTGYKEQSTKLNYELDFDFLTQVAERMSSNKGKYEPYNWKKPINVEDLKQALFRHVLEVMKGNYADDGRSMGHLEAIAANAMMINYQLKNK